MVNYKNGDIFESNAKIICHQVNCKGVMGAGPAKQVKERYPEVFRDYRKRCKNTKANNTTPLGTVMFGFVDDGIVIANMFGQDDYGTDKQYTDLDALRKCFGSVKDLYELAYNNRKINAIAIPFGVGCDLGGANLEDVDNIIHSIFDNTDYEVTVWKKD